MLTFLIVALMQAAEPAATPPAQAPAVQTAPPDQSAGANAPAAANPDNVMHCSYVIPTGTRIPVRRCSTLAQDRQRAQDDQDRLHHIEQQGDMITPSHDRGG